MADYGKTNRRIGHDAERYYARKFKELGFNECMTTRSGSKILDEAKIDLMNLPFNVQVKAGKQRNLNVVKTLVEMKEAILKLPSSMDSIKTQPKIVIVKRYSDDFSDEFSEIVSMTFKDFVKILSL